MTRKYKTIRLDKIKNSKNYYILWTTQNNNTGKKSTGTSDRAAAEIIMAELTLELEKGSINSLQSKNNYSICQALDDYYDEHIKINTKNAERVALYIKHLKKFFKDMLVTDLAPTGKKYESSKIIAKYREYRDAQMMARYKRILANSTFYNEIATLNGAKNFAVDNRHITSDEAPFIKLPEKSPARDTHLTMKEAEKFLKTCESTLIRDKNGRFKYSHSKNLLTRLFIFASIALETAARKTAILELTWFQIDLDARLIHFNPKWRIQTTKKRPTVPISDKLLPTLIRAKKEAKTEMVCFHAGTIYSSFKTAVSKSGIVKNITPHVLRHTWATWAAEHGISMEEIAMMLGDTVEVVTSTYVHLCPDYLRNAVNWRTQSPKALLDINGSDTDL